MEPTFLPLQLEFLPPFPLWIREKFEIRQNSSVISCLENDITLPSGDIVPLNTCSGWNQDYEMNVLVEGQAEFSFLTQLCANRASKEYL